MTLRKQLSNLLHRFQSNKPRQQASRFRRRRLLVEQMEDRRLLTTIDLATLTAAQGSTIFGVDAGDQNGFSVSSAGDVNGDGFDDLLIGAFRADASGNAKSSAGDSYVIFGGASLPTTTIWPIWGRPGLPSSAPM